MAREAKGGRRCTGTVLPTRDGRWQGVLTLADGSRKRLPPFPAGTSKEYAREKTRVRAEQAERDGLKKLEPRKQAPGSSGGDLWWEAYLAYRDAKGLSPVGDVYKAHIQPIIGDKHPKDWTPADCERVRDALDTKIRAGEWTAANGRRYRFGWKRAWNVWALFTSACKAASRSKNRELRVRTENPCNGVEPPDRGIDKQKQWLYPAEFLKLVSCEELPLRWRRLYALLTYTYLRPNELTALLWKDVDLEIGVLRVTKAWSYKQDRLKAYPKSAAGVRTVQLEPELVPLLTALREGAEPDDLVVPSMPPVEDWADTLRAHLRRAGVDRAALFEDTATVKQITLYDLRASGITWRTLRGDDTRRIQQAAGHERYATTEGYVRAAEVFHGRVGDPFPPLPLTLIRSQKRSQRAQVVERMASPAGFEPALQP